MKYYAVAIGTKPGIYTTWAECKKYVDGYPGAKYKSFLTKAEAQEFIDKTVAKLAKSASKPVSAKKATAAATATATATEPAITITKRRKSVIAVAPATRTAVFCDGSAINNGKKYAKASAGIVIYADGEAPLPTTIYAEALPPTETQTNQRAELYAIARSCEELTALGITEADIYTDSMYSINATAPKPAQAAIPDPTKIWAPSWRRRGWIKADGSEILHLDLIKPIHDWLVAHPSVILHHVRAHQDSKIMEWPFRGNATADWATWHARGESPPAPAAFTATFPTLATLVKTKK